MRKVAIFGAGMGGLACAHELAKLGFDVDVYEASGAVGGKAKSQYVPRTGTEGRRDLPGEHGFRFYPRFYRHTIASMEEIPDPLSPNGRVSGNLVGTTQSAFALGGDIGLVAGPRHPKDLLESLDVFRRTDVTPRDLFRYLSVIVKFMTACEERRLVEYEPMSWLDFIRADEPNRYTPQYRDLVLSMPRTMVAMDSHRGSARTLGATSALLLSDPAYTTTDLDRTMMGPTSEVWLEPWQRELERLGVNFHFHHALVALAADARKITGAKVRGPDGVVEDVVADELVAALPLEIFHRFLTPEVARLDPSLERLAAADVEALTSWMVGAQFFLDRDSPLCEGHILFPNSPWALTAISQAQFWNRGQRGMSRYGDGRLRGIVSVDISSCFAEDKRGRTFATRRSREEVLDIVWGQLLDGLGPAERRALDGAVIARHLDAEVAFDETGAHNAARLLIHPPGSYALRPDASLAVENLSIAADFVATDVDIASMEGANEAGRRAARAIASRAGIDPSRVALYEYATQKIFERTRALDRFLFRHGLPHLMEGARPMTAAATRVVRERVMALSG